MIENILMLIWLHFIADFILQSNKMAINKSTSVKWLLTHVIIYTIPFFWFGLFFAILNGIAHFITDYFTSKATSYLWKKNQRHWFFVIIGFDQAIHLSTLLITYQLIIGF